MLEFAKERYRLSIVPANIESCSPSQRIPYETQFQRLRDLWPGIR